MAESNGQSKRCELPNGQHMTIFYVIFYQQDKPLKTAHRLHEGGICSVESQVECVCFRELKGSGLRLEQNVMCKSCPKA